MGTRQGRSRMAGGDGMDMEFVESLRMSKRKEYMKLSELSDLTEQLAQATDRRDEVSAKMLVAMRQQPLLELHEIEETIREGVLHQEEEDAIRLSALMDGEEVSGPLLEEEQALREMCERNRRVMERIASVDRRVSLGLGGKRSFYNNFR